MLEPAPVPPARVPRLLARWFPRPRADPDDAPLRSQLFTAEEMEQHGARVAAGHRAVAPRSPDRLLKRLAANEKMLGEACTLLARSAEGQRRVTPAGEWLLDNFHLIEEEVRTARRHLPPGYSRELPRVACADGPDVPRVYDLALHAVAHGDGSIGRGTLTRFIQAYQASRPLQLGELWAIPIMLRLALIENLRRVATRVSRSLADRELAGQWAERMTDAAEHAPKDLILVVADMARSEPPLTASFVSELSRRLHGLSAALALPLSWIEQRLAENHQTTEQLVQLETQSQAAAQVSVSNSIGSLRLLGSMDWQDFVETLSVIEHALRGDPAGVYADMDFATRDLYRQAVERIARHAAATEAGVAAAAVALAREAGDAAGAPLAHVGHYLIADGREALLRRVAWQPPAWLRIRHAVGRRPLAVFAGAIVALTTVLTLPPLAAATHGFTAWVVPGRSGPWLTATVAALLALATSQLAVTLTNWLVTLLVRPDQLPRLDFAEGLPADCGTLVAVPSMLDSRDGIDALVDDLEVRFLANRDHGLRFALLTDLLDADVEHLPGDAALVAQAKARIEALNARHGADDDRFFLLHRDRRWNDRERLWMGAERKRGKLGDLNALLRGDGAGRFGATAGRVASLVGVRYVVTLDADTQLPRGAARRLVATMAHPLNRPRFGGDAAAPRVVGGHGILQPRIAGSLAIVGATRYCRLGGGDAGIDPYTRAVSDVYQDCFGEGSFIGKGIYDVDAFERVLAGRLPDNRVLSHDLLEGAYARCGLVSDVELVEEAPLRDDVDAKRRHRWIRGDWQIAGWALPRLHPGGATPSGAAVANPLSLLSRLKIVDNLRRSLVPAALLALLGLGWLALPEPALWTAVTLAVLTAPLAIALAADLLRRIDPLDGVAHRSAALSSARRQLERAALALALLPYEATSSLDAVVRALWRVHVSQRRLLQWLPSAEAARARPASAAADFAQTLRRMAVSPALALATAAALATWRADALWTALPVLLAWLASPAVAWWLNQPLRRRQTGIGAEQALALRALARRHWAFFETFVGAADHHLPPDNVQEEPVERIAHRTSPTNIGLSLLANLAAHDFGHATVSTLIERTTGTLDTMARLERHRGHWLNWYDTLTLQPLRPAYVSAVDSGNLGGHLWTLRAGLLALADTPAPRGETLLRGLQDTLRLLPAADPAAARLATSLAETLARPPTAPAAWRSIWQALARDTDALRPADDDGRRWALALRRQCAAALDEVAALSRPDGTGWDEAALTARADALRGLAARIATLAPMAYGFLYDAARKQLAIGFNVDDDRLDAGHYDLLASEARLALFVAIATDELPQESWFALGRQVATLDGQTVLRSWSGSMFEYLMPMLVMPSYEHTLLDETVRGAVDRQIRYGRQRGVPWGISESAYNATDAELNYQYKAFGVPGLGLKRGLASELVVAPYATVMAAMVDPRAAVANLKRLAEAGLAGTFGFHEAIDYTPSRLPPGESSAVVRSYMVHHQGMGLLALAHLLLDRPMQRRFESDPALRATLLLLQERVPRAAALQPEMAERVDFRSGRPDAETAPRVIATPHTPSPEVQLLSNGRYHVMLTNAGSGYSRWKDVAVTRWREDGTTDAWGSFCYLRDTETGTFWSTTPQPTRSASDRFEAVFSEGRAEFRRRDQGIDAYTEIVVSPEDDLELRRLRLTNRGRGRRTIELTTYSELVLAPPAADASHPAFSKLFVQTELLPHPDAILCTRRPRSADERPPWTFHAVAVHGATAGPASHETDRARFVGRGGALDAPAAMRHPGALSGSAGSVLDAIAATRIVVTLEPGRTAVVDIAHGAAESRETCVAMATKAADRRLADRIFELAWTHSQVVLRQLNATEADAQTYARLANMVVYSQPTLRPEPALLRQNRRGQSGLWGYAISGDLPIVLLQIGDAAHIDLVRQLVQAHAWWRQKGLAVDLVIWNEERDVYRQRLQEQILGFIAGSAEPHVVDRPGGIFVRQAEHIALEDRTLLRAVARATISDRLGTLEQQLGAKRVAVRRPPDLVPTRAAEPARPWKGDPTGRGLLFFNGLGGFSADGREYVVTPRRGQRPPAPWVNVIANPRFGTVVSEAGSAYTWCENAHELRLTPWHNDPVVDSGGEAMFLRDEDTGEVWSPTTPPQRTRHGFGYSVFEHERAGVASALTVFVDVEDAVKFSRLALRNVGNRPLRLTATVCVEWVLGDQREKTAPHITTELDAGTGALLARNRYSNDFGDWVGFLDVDPVDREGGSLTGDRDEFIGRNGTLARPAALRRTRLSDRTGAGIDPCGAIQVPMTLAPGDSREIVFRLGMGRSDDEAGQLVRRHRGPTAAQTALDAVHAQWQALLGAVQVRSPSPSLDLLANGWLLYQTVACRLWARSGYYQSGGAFGFRDQLQDAMAVVHTRPELLRRQLLACAGRQFAEGDVQHWWHPPGGRGVRTHISDDYLWLPLALCRYLEATGDADVLDAPAGFLDGPQVPADAESVYDLPRRAGEEASLYEHARRAVLHGLRWGVHGLPLMGAGDWNDGMNRVGAEGRGESVWLGFFLCEVLRRFEPLARQRADAEVADRCRAERAGLAERLDAAGWDGDWYRRAYFDDGTPLGSHEGAECRIDSISQSWAVLSGVAPPDRARRAMDAVAAHLVRPEAGLVQLLDPPFDRRGPNPGYVAGYVPGVRENGGQYTHGAVWAAMAFAALGDARRAWQVMDLVNPLHHGRSVDEVTRYKVEPYVVAADVYSVAPHVGRGGWTWYTGSAGWMYRLVLESLLGIALERDASGARLHVRPCVPAEWPGYEVDYRFGASTWHLHVDATRAGPPGMVVDGGAFAAGSTAIALVDDGRPHSVRVAL